MRSNFPFSIFHFSYKVLALVLATLSVGVAEAALPSEALKSAVQWQAGLIFQLQKIRRADAVAAHSEEQLTYKYKQLQLLAATDSTYQPQLSTLLAELVVVRKTRLRLAQNYGEALKQHWDSHLKARQAGLHAGQLEAVVLDWPVEPSHGISAHFKDAEYKQRFGLEHKAVDLPTKVDKPVRVAAAGVVDTIANNGLGYNYAIVKHAGYVTLYGHLTKFSVREGAIVRRGDVLGISGGEPGTPGAGALSTGKHLHFELIVDGEWLDPLQYLPPKFGVH